MTVSKWRSEMNSPLGTIKLESDGSALTRIALPGEKNQPGLTAKRCDDLPIFETARKQLGNYFEGNGGEFDLPLAPSGTDFQLRVWAELRRIPRGETITYAELAQRVGSPRAHRAVGAANGRNHLPIIVPCHRVIGSTGRLTGFAGGLEAKVWLLRLENPERWISKSLSRNA